MDSRKKIRQLKKKITENINKEYQIFLTVFFILMTVFVTSKLWLPSDVKVMNSSYGTQKNTSASTSLVLESWQYNKQENYMEISLKFKNADDTQDIKFKPTAHTNRNKSIPLNAYVAYSSNDLLMIQIKDIPQKWDVISLWVDEKDALNSSPEDEKLEALKGANFFCDIREVKINNSLKPQSELNYALKGICNQMSEIKKENSEINKQINSCNAEIKQLEFDISALKANQKYQTQDEIQKSNASVKYKINKIDDIKNNILNYQTKIKDNKLKLQKLNQKLNDTKSGKVPPVLKKQS
jgi:small-conductance mechanosensitive channel